MRSAVTSNVVVVGLVAALVSSYACSSGGGGGGNLFGGGTSGSGAGSGGEAGRATGGSGGSGGMGGADGDAGSGGQSTGGTGDTGGAAGATAGAGGQSAAGSSGTGGTAGSTADAATSSGTDGGGGGVAITKVVPTMGCGKDPGQAIGTAVRGTIQTMGTKAADAADSKKGAWSYLREYYVTLPTGYDKTKAYPLVLQGPGCGGKGTDIYPLNNNVDNTVIRVGLTPPPNDIGHATNPGQGCFDDKEGDDSVDWVFYEGLYDKLAGQLCFDKNRVFASGNSSGAWFSNELGCKYAGDATRPVRGIMPNTGGLPTDMRYVPTCTNKPMAGMWSHEIGDMENPFSGNKVAIARAMKVNGCTIGTSFDNAQFDNFPIGGNNPDTTCKKIKGCPELYPLVVCALPGNAHGSHDNVANPGFSTFIKLFSAPSLLAP